MVEHPVDADFLLDASLLSQRLGKEYPPGGIYRHLVGRSKENADKVPGFSFRVRQVMESF